MTEELLKLVEQLIEFDYGDPLRLNSIYDRLKNGELPYPSDQRYVDMLVSKYLYPHMDEDKNSRKPLGSLEKKIQYVITDYSRKTKRTNPLRMTKNEYDVKRYAKLLAECCETVTKPFGLKITL